MMNMSLRNIYLIGMMGVGKSTVGRILANQLKWAFVDVNEMLEAIYNRPLLEISNNLFLLIVFFMFILIFFGFSYLGLSSVK